MRVTVKDFRIKLSWTHVRAGNVQFVVENRGPDTHEVLIARTSVALPLRADNITVDEDAPRAGDGRRGRSRAARRRKRCSG